MSSAGATTSCSAFASCATSSASRSRGEPVARLPSATTTSAAGRDARPAVASTASPTPPAQLAASSPSRQATACALELAAAAAGSAASSSSTRLEQAAELEAAEDLLQLRAVGRARARARPGRRRAARSRRIVASSFDARAWSACSRDRLRRAPARARRRARSPPRASRTARSAGRRSCRRSPECPGCCRTCRP